LYIGSADAVRPGTADLIAANISPETIARLAPELLRCLRPGGVALLSGFEGHETAAVSAELKRHGGALGEVRVKGNWALLVVRGKLVGGV
jgi:ribosomal protein L11 methylase PrmA